MAGPRTPARTLEDVVKIEQLTRDPKNRRRRTDRSRELIARSLKLHGPARSIVIDEDNQIIAGNGVVEAAPDAGISNVRIVDADGSEIIAVRRTGLSAEQKRDLAISDNRASELSEWNVEQLREDSLNGFDLSTFFDAAEIQAIQAAAITPKKGKTDPDDVPARRRTTIKPGDLFTLGRHRLLCGDATTTEDVARVLEGGTPQLMVTDPPYGVSYDPSWRVKAGLKGAKSQKLGTVTNDHRADWRAAWERFPGGIAYVWHAGLKTALIEESLEYAGFTLRNQIIWAKDRLVLGRGDYHWQHEACWYAIREGQPSRRTADRKQTTLWRISAGVVSTLWEIPARDDEGHGHGTQKPVECMARAMRNHLAPEVYDPFLGSGTSFIAAETLARRCYGLEIEPEYCQVIIDRWEAFTGKKAVKVDEAATPAKGRPRRRA